MKPWRGRLETEAGNRMVEAEDWKKTAMQYPTIAVSNITVSFWYYYSLHNAEHTPSSTSPVFFLFLRCRRPSTSAYKWYTNHHWKYAHHTSNQHFIANSVCYTKIIFTVIKTEMYLPGMWSRSRRLGLETVSRHTNVSSRSRLDQNAQRLGLVSVSDLCVLDLVSVSTQNVSGLGPFRLVETFHAGAPNLTTILQWKPVGLCLIP